jgi:hypothetical protein
VLGVEESGPILSEPSRTEPIDLLLITPLERYHDKNPPRKVCRGFKILSIFLDEHLTLNYHTEHLVSKLTRSTYCIKQAKHIRFAPIREIYLLKDVMTAYILKNIYRIFYY